MTTEQDTTLIALFNEAVRTGDPEDKRALIDAWKRLCAVLDTAEVDDA